MVSLGSSSAMDPVLVDASEDIPNVTEEPSKKATRGFSFSGVCGTGVASFDKRDIAEDSVGEPNCM